MRIVIPDIPPSQNEWDRLDWARNAHGKLVGRFVKAKIKRHWKKYFDKNFGFEWKQNHRGYATKVTIRIRFPDEGRRDADNYFFFKPLRDGLVQQGIIEDDTELKVKFTNKLEFGTGKRETVIELEE